jgi:putative two-component system response regulator
MKKHILFVDDEQNQLDTWKRSLSSMKKVWEMVFLQDSNQVIDETRKTPFDVIVLDVMMPGKNGFTLLKMLIQADETKNIPIIMVTGAGQRVLKRRALEIGATDLLDKPVDLDDLIARISSALRLKSYYDRLKELNENLEKEVQARTIALDKYRLDVVWRLAKAGEYRDKGTGNHVLRVGYYSRVIAEALGMPADFVRSIFYASALHDIGKIGIPDAILLKPDSLTLEERRVMEKHCEIGANLLQEYIGTSEESIQLVDNPLLSIAAKIALSHHERWDGCGYPSGLAGEAVPLESRIVSVADAYDALCSERPYKPTYPECEVIKMMRSEVGAQFDPRVFKAFERSLKQIHTIRKQYSDDLSLFQEEVA